MISALGILSSFSHRLTDALWQGTKSAKICCVMPFLFRRSLIRCPMVLGIPFRFSFFMLVTEMTGPGTVFLSLVFCRHHQYSKPGFWPRLCHLSPTSLSKKGTVYRFFWHAYAAVQVNIEKIDKNSPPPRWKDRGLKSHRQKAVCSCSQPRQLPFMYIGQAPSKAAFAKQILSICIISVIYRLCDLKLGSRSCPFTKHLRFILRNSWLNSKTRLTSC